jgi:hypothetical protein
MAPKKRKLKSLPGKAVSTRKAEALKGGRRKNERLSANHNQVLRTR